MKSMREKHIKVVRFKETEQSLKCSGHVCSCNAVYCNIKHKKGSRIQAVEQKGRKTNGADVIQKERNS